MHVRTMLGLRAHQTPSLLRPHCCGGLPEAKEAMPPKEHGLRFTGLGDVWGLVFRGGLWDELGFRAQDLWDLSVSGSPH